MSSTTRRLLGRLGPLLLGLPVAIQAWLVARYGVDMPLWDELYYADFVRAVRAGDRWAPWLWRQHNEHRVVASKLVMAAVARWARWNLVVEMYVSVALAALLVAGLWRLYRASGGADVLRFAPAAFLVGNLAGYENMLYGLLTCHYFTVTGAVWALALLAGGGTVAVVGALLAALLASFSVLNGFLVWPAGAFLLATQRRWKAATAWLMVGAVATALYLHGFQRPPATTTLPSPSLRDAAHLIAYLVALCGAPLGAGSTPWSIAIGISVLTAVTVVAWTRVRARSLPASDRPLAALGLYGLTATATIAVGRMGSAIRPDESRYILYSSLPLVALWLALASESERLGKRMLAWAPTAAALGLLVPGLLAANAKGLVLAGEWHRARLRERFLVQSADSQRDVDLAGIYFVPSLRASLPYLRRERLGPFAVPQSLLLLVRWQEGTPTADVAAGRPVLQRFRCPVDELRDVAVAFASGGSTPATVTLADASGRPLARREVPAQLVPGWQPLELPSPLARCAGRELLVSVASAAPAGSGARLWTYPTYYSGRLVQGAGEEVANRSLGLELNALSSGLLGRP